MKKLFHQHKKLLFSSLTGCVFVSALGSLMHFVYHWSGNYFLVGLIAPVNESTWEHMKLLFFPLLLYNALECLFLKKTYAKLLKADAVGLLSGTLLIPVIFYTYTGILGFHTLLLDILTFLASVLLSFYIRLKILLSCHFKRQTITLLIFVLALGACFLIFTYYPPGIGLFRIPS